jgi:hypothetical protein
VHGPCYAIVIAGWHAFGVVRHHKHAYHDCVAESMPPRSCLVRIAHPTHPLIWLFIATIFLDRNGDVG